MSTPPSTIRTPVPSEKALSRRDAMLKGATELAMTLVSCESEEEALDTTARIIGHAARADRVIVSEALRTASGSFVHRSRAIWRADGARPDAKPAVSRADHDLSAIDRVSGEMDLVSGAGVYLSRSESDLLAGVEVRDMVSVPVLVAGQWWGAVGVFDHDPDGSWSGAATDILQTAANTLGATLGLLAARRAVRRASARQRASEQAQVQDAARFRALVQGSADVLALVDADGRYRYVSPAIEETLGLTAERLVGRAFMERVHPEDMARCTWNFVALGRSPDGTMRFACRVLHVDGDFRRIEVSARNALRVAEVGAYVLSLRDAADRRRVWGAAMAAGARIALGTLSRGIASGLGHDATVEVRDRVDALGATSPVRAVDLAAALERVALVAGVDLPRRVASDLWSVVGQAAAVEHALTEIVREAVRVSGGALRIEAGNVRIAGTGPRGMIALDPRPSDPADTGAPRVVLAPPTTSPPGVPADSADVISSTSATSSAETDISGSATDGSVDSIVSRFGDDSGLDDSLAAASESVVSVDDNSASLAAASLEIADAPRPGLYALIVFNLERGAVDRRSLPLHIARAVAQRFGGRLVIGDAIHRGARIEFWLPRAAEGSTADSPGTIVVLESEPAVRELVVRMLRRLRYPVFVTADPAEAAARCAAADVILFLCEVVMPALSGPELASHIRATRPGLPVIYTAGRLDEARRIGHRAAARLLIKPFTLDTLSERLQAALG